MNKYLVQYNLDGFGKWITFGIEAPDMFQALDWVHDNVQYNSVAIYPYSQ